MEFKGSVLIQEKIQPCRGSSTHKLYLSDTLAGLDAGEFSHSMRLEIIVLKRRILSREEGEENSQGRKVSRRDFNVS